LELIYRESFEEAIGSSDGETECFTQDKPVSNDSTGELFTPDTSFSRQVKNQIPELNW
jgi:hypothetical protein